MDQAFVERTEQFLKDTFSNSVYLQAHPTDWEYRIQHSYRVANLAKYIAQQEGLDVTDAVIAGLLHDIAYCEEMPTQEAQRNHGRRSAAIARTFLEQQGLDPARINTICYSIAIHVDDKADFTWEHTAFSNLVGDADNIDRFDAYRIYETLEYRNFSSLAFSEKQAMVNTSLERLEQLKGLPFGSPTATTLWVQRLEYYISFYQRLQDQLRNSTQIL